MMAPVRIRDALMFAVLMTALHLGQPYTREEDIEDITKFYHEGAKLRTLYTTIEANKCNVDRVTTARGQRIQIERFSVAGGKTTSSLILEGLFTNKRFAIRNVPWDAMDLHQKNNAQYYLFERLYRTCDRNTCGIFYVSRHNHRGGQDYEIRVKVGSPQNNNDCPECFEALQKYTRKAVKTACNHKG
uniref:Putative group i salivary lipocalin n=1 Tax=Rhipicephalus pulchellus TaxID=72859 RepID=L7LR03_RHIPC